MRKLNSNPGSLVPESMLESLHQPILCEREPGLGVFGMLSVFYIITIYISILCFISMSLLMMLLNTDTPFISL